MVLKVNWKSLMLLSLGMIMLGSCTDKKKEQPSASGEADRKKVLENVADQIIIPSYARFQIKMDSLVLCSQSFTTTTNANTLTQFRKAWEKAYLEWQKIELIDVGPANDITLRFYFNTFPLDTTLVKSKIAQGSTAVVEAGKAIQGFPALDFLLYGQGTDEQTLLKYTTDEHATKRINYLKAVVSTMDQKFSLAYTPWKNGYRETFVSNGSVSAGSPFNVLVQNYILNYEKYFRSGKFGIPAGIFSTTPLPDHVEAVHRKDLSLALAHVAHTASTDFFNGKSVLTGAEGPSFNTYLKALNAKVKNTDFVLSDKINERFANIQAKMSLLKPNLIQEVKTNNAAVIAVFDEIQTQIPLLKADMASAMSVMITYVDSDGD